MRLAHITHVRVFWQFVGHLDQVIQKQLDKSKVEQYRDRDLLHWTRWRFVQVRTTAPDDSDAQLKQRNAVLSEALLPSSTQLLRLLTTTKQNRPDLKNFHLNVECRIPWDPKDKVYIPASWSFTYPSLQWTDAEGNDEIVRWEQKDHEQTNPVKITRIRIADEDCAMVAVKDKHIHGACNFILMEKDAHRVLSSIFGGFDWADRSFA